MPEVSVIIPAYNYGGYIKECLDSCIEQTFTDTEIIVIDDASTDNTRSVIESYPVKLISLPENRGYSYCKNVGIREATGKYIVHLDADDVLTPESVKIRLDSFEPGVDVVHGLAWRYRWSGTEWVIDGYNEKSKIHAQGVMIKRSVYEKHGLYYEKLRSKADKEMWYRLGIHPESPLPKLVKAKKIKNFVAYYRKHEKQMHKLRKQNKEARSKTESIFKARIKQLSKEGITRENTAFL